MPSSPRYALGSVSFRIVRCSPHELPSVLRRDVIAFRPTSLHGDNLLSQWWTAMARSEEHVRSSIGER